MSRSELRSEILRGPTSWQENRGMAVTGTRSVPLAFGLSAVVPGAGQVYNGFFIKGGVAIALEAALITGYSVLRSNGLDAETEFQKWAHRSWSPVKYASWINDYADYLRDELGVSISAPPVDLISGIDLPNQIVGPRAKERRLMASSLRFMPLKYKPSIQRRVLGSRTSFLLLPINNIMS